METDFLKMPVSTQIAIILNGDTRESKSHNQLIEAMNT